MPADADGKWQVKVLGTGVLPDGKINKVDNRPGRSARRSRRPRPTTICRRWRSNISSRPNISVETICCLTQHHVDGIGPAAGAELVSIVLLVPATLTLKYHLDAGGITPYVGAGPACSSISTRSRVPSASGGRDQDAGCVERTRLCAAGGRRHPGQRFWHGRQPRCQEIFHGHHGALVCRQAPRSRRRTSLIPGCSAPASASASDQPVIASSAARSRMSTARRLGRSITPSDLSRVNWRLTVSIVSPRISPTCWRENGRSKRSSGRPAAPRSQDRQADRTSPAGSSPPFPRRSCAPAAASSACTVKFGQRAAAAALLQRRMLAGKTVKIAAGEQHTRASVSAVTEWRVRAPNGRPMKSEG